MFRTTLKALVLFGLAFRLTAADPVKAQLIAPGQRAAAPSMKLKDRKGALVDLQSLTGKAVLLDFWATYCGGCKKELPWFQEFYAKYGPHNFAVVAVSMDEGWPAVQKFVDPLGINFTIVLDDGDVSTRYNLREMPAAFLIDRKGRVAAKYVGLVDRGNLEGNIRSVLAEKVRP